MNDQWDHTSTLSSSLSDQRVQQGQADIDARRSISDSVLHRGHAVTYHKKNTIMMMVSRSGGATVKEIIDIIHQQCDLKERNAKNPCAIPPEAECCVLAQWAVDSYYQVVIANKEGIQAIVRVMTVFPDYRGIQEACCLALGNLCVSNGKNLKLTEGAGGVQAVIAAMRNHPQSVAVQSAACDALRNMSGLILIKLSSATTDVGSDLLDVLSRAKEMPLHPSHRHIATALYQQVMTASENQRTCF